MAKLQANDEEDPSAFQNDSSSGITPPETPSKPTRSLTPRGPLFPSLNEAHRIITSRLGSNNPFRKDFNHSISAQAIPLQELTNPFSSSGDDTKSLSDCLSSSNHAHPIPRSSIMAIGRSLTNPPKYKHTQEGSAEVAHSILKPTERVQCRPKPDLDQLDTSDNTVEQIFEHYASRQKEGRASSLESSSLGHTISTSHLSPGLRFAFEQAAAEASRLQEGILSTPSRRASRREIRQACLTAQMRDSLQRTNGSKYQGKLNLPSTNPPTGGLPRNPPPGRRQYAPTTTLDVSDIDPTYSSNTPDTEHVLDLSGEENNGQVAAQSLMPRPLRVPTTRRRAKQNKLTGDADFYSDGESTTAEETTDSHPDPFRYDDLHYKDFFQPLKEREVSQALLRMSETPCFNRESLIDPGDGYRGRLPSIFSAYETDGKQINTPGGSEADIGFYNLPAFGHQISVDRPFRDIKIVVGHRRVSNHDQDLSRVDRDPFRDNAAGGDAARRLLTIPRNTTNDADWVTVATSEAAIGGETVTDNRYFKPGAKVTGSSLADYSDDQDVSLLPPVFSSQEHIVQHPGMGRLSHGYDVYNLKGTKQAVLLPKPKLCRVNGFAQNSLRIYPESQEARSPGATPMPRKWSNPFGRRSYRRTDAIGHFPSTARHQCSSKYDFRDSASEYNQAFGSNHATLGSQSVPPSRSMSFSVAERIQDGRKHAKEFEFDRRASMDSDRSRRLNLTSLKIKQTPQGSSSKLSHMDDLLPYKYPRRPIRAFEEDQQFAPIEASGIEEVPNSAVSKFDFQLLPLDHAQAVLKERRESGEADETEPGHVRYHRARSSASSRRVVTPNPVRRPTVAHLRLESRRQGAKLGTTQETPNWRLAGRQPQGTPTTGGFSNGLNSPSTVCHSPQPFSPEADSPWTPATQYDIQTPILAKINNNQSDEPQLLLGRDQAFLEGAKPTLHRPHTGLTRETLEELQISETARLRRALWFSTMLTLSVLPFFALLVLTGVFNETLAWFTDGEVRRLTRGQRKVIKVMFMIEGILGAACVTAIVVYFVVKIKLGN